MYFDSLSEFLAMDGHGLYVWMSYGIFIVVILWNLFIVRQNRKLSLKRAEKTWQRETLAKKPVDDLNQEQNSVEN